MTVIGNNGIDSSGLANNRLDLVAGQPALLPHPAGQGLTQAGLGLRLDPPVTRAAIANVENGKQRVLAHTLVQLAQILRVEIKRLVAPPPNPRSASVQQQALERELKKKLVVSSAALKRLSTRFVTQS